MMRKDVGFFFSFLACQELPCPFDSFLQSGDLASDTAVLTEAGSPLSLHPWGWGCSCAHSVGLSDHVLVYWVSRTSTLGTPGSRSVWLYTGCHSGLHAHCPVVVLGRAHGNNGLSLWILRPRPLRGGCGTTCPFLSWLTFSLFTSYLLQPRAGCQNGSPRPRCDP